MFFSINHLEHYVYADNSGGNTSAKFHNYVSTFDVFPQLSPDGGLPFGLVCMDAVLAGCLARLRLTGHGCREEPERHGGQQDTDGDEDVTKPPAADPTRVVRQQPSRCHARTPTHTVSTCK